MLYEPHENAYFDDSIENYLTIRIEKELYSLLLQDPEYRECQKKLFDTVNKLVEVLPDKYKLLNELSAEVKTKENKFYYTQGINDGLKLKKLFGDVRGGSAR